jgi:hypothetical protein
MLPNEKAVTIFKHSFLVFKSKGAIPTYTMGAKATGYKCQQQRALQRYC